MTAKSKARESRSRKPDFASDIEKRIRQRAYELYEQRGSVDGFCLGRLAPSGGRHSRNAEVGPQGETEIGDENLDVDRGVLWAT